MFCYLSRLTKHQIVLRPTGKESYMCGLAPIDPRQHLNPPCCASVLAQPQIHLRGQEDDKKGPTGTLSGDDFLLKWCCRVESSFANRGGIFSLLFPTCSIGPKSFISGVQSAVAAEFSAPDHTQQHQTAHCASSCAINRPSRPPFILPLRPLQLVIGSQSGWMPSAVDGPDPRSPDLTSSRASITFFTPSLPLLASLPISPNPGVKVQAAGI